MAHSLMRPELAACHSLHHVRRLLAGVTIASGGVLPNIHAVLVKSKPGKAKAGAAAEEDDE